MKDKELLLDIIDLNVSYTKDEIALRDFNLKLYKGESLGIIGESGSGKTTLVLSILALLKNIAETKGEIYYREKSLLKCSNEELNKIRWDKISVVFQNDLNTLNPLITIKEQFMEVFKKLGEFLIGEAMDRICEILKKVSLDKAVLDMYPHQLSGGMRQRILIAMAILCNPEILILDEPTSSLDELSKLEIEELIIELKEKECYSMIVISHDFAFVKKVTDKLMVLNSGLVIEEGDTNKLIAYPCHGYTRGLLNSALELNPYQDLWGIHNKKQGEISLGCPYYNSCNQSSELCSKNIPELMSIEDNRKIRCLKGGIITLLNVKNIKKKYYIGKNTVKACNDCSFNIRSGEILALIGQSGSGKTTLASIISGTIRGDSGKVFFEDNEVNGNNFTSKFNGVQMIYQDPYSSINENFSVIQAIIEPLEINKIFSEGDRQARFKKVIKDVQLPENDKFFNRKCKTLSGGQRQRVAIARSLIMEPKLIVADEITSMLDPSTKAEILRLLKSLQIEKGFSMLYITHDLFVARKISNRVLVMKDGEIIENGDTYTVFSEPQREYTQRLIKNII